MAPKKDPNSKATAAKKSLATFKQHSEMKINDIKKFLEKNAQIESMTLDQQNSLKSKREKMESQVERYETAFDEHYKAILDEDATLEEEEKNYDKFAADLADTIKTMQALSEEVEDFIKNHGATANANGGNAVAAPPSSSKIDDTLRPRETLLRTMSLEEFNVWSDKFTAYIRQNERLLSGQSTSVKREILYNCLGSSLVQALKTDSTITDATPIIGDNCSQRQTGGSYDLSEDE